MQIDELSGRIGDCKRCGLHRTRRRIVMGRGVIPAQVLILGEGPGLSEDLTGESFAGPSGRMLDQLLVDACKLGITAVDTPSMFISNIILCHPTDEFAGDNRIPEKEEVFSCACNVIEIFRCVQPRLVVFAGGEAKDYYGREFPKSVEIYHPSFLLRTGAQASRYYMHTVRILHDAFEDLQEEIENEKNLSEEGAR